MDRFRPVEDRWLQDSELVDPFRPGLRHRARSDAEFDALTAQHLARVHEAFVEADVVIFALGLSEAWLSRADGAVFPARLGMIAGEFDPDRHVFHNFTVEETVSDLRAIYALLAQVRPGIRMILTVSPVPLIATATADHVLLATTYSKSVLRVACGVVCRDNPAIAYFPAYEIITGPQAGGRYYEADKRNVSAAGVEAVMAVFLAHCEARTSSPVAAAPPTGGDAAVRLSQLLIAAECEEAAHDGRLENPGSRLAGRAEGRPKALTSG